MTNLFNVIKDYFVVTWQRLKSDTPKYWRRLSMIGLLITATATFLTENDAIVPEQYKWITKYVTAMAAAVAIVSRFATTSKELSEKSEEILTKAGNDEKLDNI